MLQTTYSPLRIFSVSLLCQFVAGVEYWWPALLTSLQPRLNFTATQSMVLNVVASSGGTLSIPIGFFHSHYGSRKSALLGSFALVLSFVVLAGLPFVSNQLWFPIALLATSASVPASYSLYAASLSLTSAVFPLRFRGRVVGLATAAYGASTAMYSAMQSAFFPNPEDVVILLLTCASMVAFVGMLVACFFPPVDHFDNEPEDHFQQNYQSISDPVTTDSLLDASIFASYKLICILVILLQICTITEAMSAPSILLKASTSALLPVVLLLLTAVPRNSPFRIRASTETSTGSHGSLLSVIKDERFHYLAFARFLIIGGGGLTLLLQSTNIITSRFALDRPEAIPSGVRTLVMIFATSNLTSRLAAGLLMDVGSEEESLFRKYSLLHTDSLILAITLPLLALLPYWAFLLGVAIVGVCHGVFYSSAPALCTLWFGVRDYPRNWSALGPFQLLAVSTIASSVPAVMMKWFGTWEKVEGERVCVGFLCLFPTFVTIATMQFALYCVGWFLKTRLKWQTATPFQSASTVTDRLS